MSRNSDLPDELPPTESQVVSKIEAALDDVLDDLGLDPDQKSIKYEKYVYLTAAGFPVQNEPAISYSWFRWGVSTLAGSGGAAMSGPLYTSNASASTIVQADSSDLEDFIKNSIPDFPIQEWWEKPGYEFLKKFYTNYAKDEYRELYLANIELLESIEFIEKTVQRKEVLISESTYRRACEWTSKLEREVASISELQREYDAVSYFTELYRDVVLVLTQLSSEEIEPAQLTAVNQLADLYENKVWPMLAHGLSEMSAEGPNKDKIEHWASSNRSRLWDEFEDVNVREICEFAELSREFKTYPDTRGDRLSEQTAGSVDVIDILNDKDSSPKISDFVGKHSLKKFADLIDLTPEYTEGKITYRGVANAVGLSYESAFEMLDILVPLINEVQESQRIQSEDLTEETRNELLRGVDI